MNEPGTIMPDIINTGDVWKRVDRDELPDGTTDD